MLVHFLRELPWAKCNESTEIIRRKGLSPKAICTEQLPKDLLKFLTYARQRPDEKPRYDFWRRKFHKLYVRYGFKYDHVFDWTKAIHAHAMAKARE